MEVAAGALINSHHGMDNAHKMDLAGRVGSALPDIDSLRTSYNPPPTPPHPLLFAAKSSPDIVMDPRANTITRRFKSSVVGEIENSYCKMKWAICVFLKDPDS